MSVLGDLDSIVLRETSHPPLSTKGSELTYAEWDAQTTKIYDAIQSIVSGTNVTAYDAGTTYDDSSSDVYLKFAGYDGRIWQAIGSHSGNTPEEGTFWTQVTLAELLPDVLKVADQSASDGVVVKHKKLTIESADVLTLNATPITIVDAPGSGYAIEVMSASVSVDFDTTPYATYTDIELKNAGSDLAQAKAIGALAASVSRRSNFAISPQPTAAQTVMTENTALQVTVNDGEPTGGNSDITICVSYRIIET